jgi:uncharacterized protein with PIN domain
MPLLNIEEFKIKKIVEGASCPKCGGELIPSSNKPLSGKIIRALSLGVIKTKSYECKECERIIQTF